MIDQRFRLSSFVLGLLVSGLILFSAVGGALADRVFVIRPLDRVWPRGGQPLASQPASLPEFGEPAIAVAKKSRASVVTVAAKRPVPRRSIELPFGPMIESNETELVQQDIGTGFSVSLTDGLIVTNRHVVADPSLEYKIIDVDGQEYEVQKIYRDPTNDLAILQTTAHLPALALSDSDQLQVGQSVVAIGTSLGEFRQSVTTGVVSGLGRGIDASDGFSAEHIDDLIQTDAAINPGNSGGPLLNLSGETVGVNVAMADAENIGFAIPINIVKASIDNFNATGRFDRPLLGVQYKLIPRETALLNDVPEGAYVVEVLAGTTAEKIGIQTGDILTKVDGQNTRDVAGGLAGIINRKKIGDTVAVEVWRNGQLQTLTGALLVAPS
jgi:S1-C subfamily serine protease